MIAAMVPARRISAGVSEDCGHIELHAMFHQLLADWLGKR
jgi:hypothetical protein